MEIFLWCCRGSKRDSTFENILKRPLMFPAKPVVSPECQVSFSMATHSLCTTQNQLQQLPEGLSSSTEVTACRSRMPAVCAPVMLRQG